MEEQEAPNKLCPEIPDDWDFFKNIDFSDQSILQYHIDTRDFHCVIFKEQPEKPLDFVKILRPFQLPKFIHTPEEVMELLTRYYNDSGGNVKSGWRLFCLEGEEGWIMKYIRIYRVDQGLVICNSHHHALNKEFLSRKVQKEY